ncbi:MAG: serine/threonine protein kinase [Myxococcales bacterium]|nr:serine/threonine protein kinase [Myxococcales bacterium]
MRVEVKQALIDISALPQNYGKYELLERIGVGGMAEVYRARLPGVGGFAKEIVIKRLRPKHARDNALVQLFIEEAKLAAHVTHKNVVQVYELGHLDSGELFIAMEYVRGTDLRRLTDLAARAALRVPVWLALHIILELLEALGYAHDCTDDNGRPRNLVHCDVTPENIFISRSGDIKLGDFGVASDDTRVNVPLSDQPKGKLPYMSPEQVLEQPIDNRTDIFSTAVVLWETITGRRLFPGRTPSEVMAQICASPRPPPSKYAAGIQEALDQVILRALTPDINERFQSAHEFSGALKEHLAHLRPRLTTEDVRRALLAIMDAPIVRPNASTLDIEDDEDDDYDELRALDLRHDSHPRSLTHAHAHRHGSALRQTVQPGLITRSSPSSASSPNSLVLPKTRTDRRIQPRSIPYAPEITTEFTGSGLEMLEMETEDEQTSRMLRDEVTIDSMSSPEPISYEPLDTSFPDTTTWGSIRHYNYNTPENHNIPENHNTPENPANVQALMQAYIFDDEDNTLINSVAGSTNLSVLSGAAPLWAKSVDGQILGPMPPYELLELLHRTEKRPHPIFLISTDLERWLNPYELALLLGERLMDRDVPAGPQLPRGSLAKHSFVEVSGSLARNRWSGVLSVWSEQGHDRECVEVHLSQGAITHIRWTGAPFETWRALFDDNELGALGLPEAFSQGIASGTRVVEHLPSEVTERILENRRIHARRQLQAAIGWSQGGFSYNRRANILRSDHPQSLLKLLPSLVHRAFSPEELQRRLKNRLYHRHRLAPAFIELRNDLGLTEEEMTTLSYLGNGATLGEAGLKLQGQADGKFIWVMAYLLAEIGLLSVE